MLSEPKNEDKNSNSQNVDNIKRKSMKRYPVIARPNDNQPIEKE